VRDYHFSWLLPGFSNLLPDGSDMKGMIDQGARRLPHHVLKRSRWRSTEATLNRRGNFNGPVRQVIHGWHALSIKRASIAFHRDSAGARRCWPGQTRSDGGPDGHRTAITYPGPR